MLGVICTFSGAVAVQQSWPRTVMVAAGPGRERPEVYGSMEEVFAGGVLWGVGVVLLLVAVVAYGVRLGRESSPSVGGAVSHHNQSA